MDLVFPVTAPPCSPRVEEEVGEEEEEVMQLAGSLSLPGRREDCSGGLMLIKKRVALRWED